MVTHVTGGLRMYGVTISRPGTLDYTRAELRNGPVALTLGGLTAAEGPALEARLAPGLRTGGARRAGP